MRKLVITATLSALVLWTAWWLARPEPWSGTPLSGAEVGGELHAPTQPPPARSPAPRASDRPANADCASQQHRACLHGDVWWLDSCERPERKAEECGAQLCVEGECEKPDPAGCGPSQEFGRCEGEVVRGCHAGRPYARDCGAVGKRCVVGEEGARCAEVTGSRCRLSDRPYCTDEGLTLMACREGQWFEIDCAALGAHCMRYGDAHVAACVEVLSDEEQPDDDGALALRSECGPCGCDHPLAVERCDESAVQADDPACEPVPLVAYVISSNGRSSYEPADFDAELAAIEATFSGHEGLFDAGFEWIDVVSLDRPKWLDLSDADFGALARDVALLGADYGFHVPIVFTDTITNGEVPALGVAPLPNGHCGGVRRHLQPQTPFGVVAVAKSRAPTTVAHEIGHYLGLCHTHGELHEAVRRLALTPEGEVSCREPCQLEGDAICDTPPDPGPELCAYGATCELACHAAAWPDPTNVMSYYTACRSRFTPQQALEMRRGLALRREWFPCLQPAGCPCEPTAPACPRQMSCRPSSESAGAGSWQCSLDGAVAVGQPCEHSGMCRDGAICISAGGAASCVRPCVTSAAGCTCNMGRAWPVGICSEDLSS